MSERIVWLVAMFTPAALLSALIIGGSALAPVLRGAPAQPAALLSCKAAVDAVIVAMADEHETQSERCFSHPPMCSGANARPVCICGFYASSCRWECAQ